MQKPMGLALLFLLGSATLSAQTTEADISTRLLNKPLQLRGFWMDDNLTFDAAGNPSKTYKTGSFTESGINVRTVSVRGNRLEMEGDRMGLQAEQDEVDEDGGPLFDRVRMTKGGSKTETIKISVDGGQNADFTKALDTIFAVSLSELAPTVPIYWQPFFHKYVLHDKTTASPSPKRSPLTKGDSSVQPPKVLKSENPRYTDAARKLGFSGRILVSLVVDADGMPQDIHIQHPAGLGLDEQAVKAVNQYRFKPATKNGQPIKVELSIDVNFEIRNSQY
jgi:TonB family protein